MNFQEFLNMLKPSPKTVDTLLEVTHYSVVIILISAVALSVHFG